MSKLLQQLLNRDDYVAIEGGKLVILPASGQPVPLDWLATHQQELINALIKTSGKEAYSFTRFSVGSYGKHKADGVTLFFTNLLTGEQFHAVYNVHRSRRDGKGKLKGNQFRITEQMALSQLYFKLLERRPEHKRLSEGHRLIAHFKDLVLTFDSTNGKADKATITTLSFIPLNGKNMGVTWETYGKNVGNFRGNDFPIRPDTATITDKSNYVSSELRNKLISRDVISNSFTSLNSSLIDSNSSNEFHTKKRPEDQTVDEWLVDYDGAKLNNKH